MGPNEAGRPRVRRPPRFSAFSIRAAPGLERRRRGADGALGQHLRAEREVIGDDLHDLVVVVIGPQTMCSWNFFFPLVLGLVFVRVLVGVVGDVFGAELRLVERDGVLFLALDVFLDALVCFWNLGLALRRSAERRLSSAARSFGTRLNISCGSGSTLSNLIALSIFPSPVIAWSASEGMWTSGAMPGSACSRRWPGRTAGSSASNPPGSECRGGGFAR